MKLRMSSLKEVYFANTASYMYSSPDSDIGVERASSLIRLKLDVGVGGVPAIATSLGKFGGTERDTGKRELGSDVGELIH